MDAQAMLAYVGDAAEAAGFRLAGARVFSPAPGEELAALSQAREAAQIVLLSAEVAAALSRAELESAQAALRPLLAIVPRGRDISVRDPAERVRHQLGLER